MNDIDRLLARLGTLPLDPRLSGIDDVVMAGLAEARQPVLSRAGLGAVAAGAMAIGVLASALPGAPAHAASAFPLGVPGNLAPSTLLGDGR